MVYPVEFNMRDLSGVVCLGNKARFSLNIAKTGWCFNILLGNDK